MENLDLTKRDYKWKMENAGLTIRDFKMLVVAAAVVPLASFVGGFYLANSSNATETAYNQHAPAAVVTNEVASTPRPVTAEPVKVVAVEPEKVEHIEVVAVEPVAEQVEATTETVVELPLVKAEPQPQQLAEAPAITESSYVLQAGLFSNSNNAQKYAKSLREKSTHG